jgi:RimJ/RimL family protein N-acetyltransferase
VQGELVPRLETPRLTLRGWRESDLDAYAAMAADSEVMRYMGGALDRNQSWGEMALGSGHWLLRGYGSWAVERTTDEILVGRVGLWNPEGWLGLEIGWKLARHAWGNGYATEAALAAIAWAWARLETKQLISVIHRDNARSIRVAERLGLRQLREEALAGEPCLIFGIDRPATAGGVA